MNGELDIIPQRSLRRILSGSNVCHSNHPNLKLHISALDGGNYPTRSDIVDFECSSSGVLSACSDGLCDDAEGAIGAFEPTITNPLTEAVLNRNNSSNTSDVSANCSTEENTSNTQPLAADYDGIRRLQSNSKLPNFLNPSLTDEKFFNNSSMFEEIRSNVISEDAGFYHGGQNFGQPKQLPNVEMTSRLLDSALSSDLVNTDGNIGHFNAALSKSKHKPSLNFSIGEPDCDDNCGTTNANWGRFPLASSEDPSTLNTVNDPIPHLMGSMSDQSVMAFDNVLPSQYSSNPTSAAAKRAITGGHQNNKLGLTTRPNTWSTSASGAFQVPANPINWGVSSKNGAVSLTSSSPGASVIGLPSSSPTSWSGSQQASKVNNLSNILSNLSLDSSAPGAPVPTRSMNTNLPLACGRTSSCLTNIYSMFPKRPQHRMMAHWQQQQQHHSGNSHNQSARNTLAMQNNSLSHVSTSRVSANVADSTGASGDNALLNFNNGSVLQAISSIPPITNPLSVCSSGDSFGTAASIVSSAADTSTSLDTFKFGLDQQLMEAIKAFGPSGITSNPAGTLDGTTNEPALILNNMDEPVTSFGEVDQQLSNLSTMNHLSLFGQNSCSSNTSGFAGLGCTNNHAASLRNLSGIPVLGSMGLPHSYPVFTNVPAREEGYSRKVFVGGLPPDIDEEEITTAFHRFGPLIVDWPHKTESKAYFPPKGYCFLLFQDERSVQNLINACIVDEGKYYWCVSSPTMKEKPVQIRPWNLADSDFVMDGSQPLDPRKTIFVGGVPRPLRAIELAFIMDRLYSGVCYAGIDTDPELKYPKGAGRVAFSNQQSYIAAISARFVQLQHNEIDKRVEVKPYVLDNQLCDECQGARCGGKFAPFFCANVACLQYYCEQCWVQIHSRNGREYHKPLVKEGAERPRPALYRW